MAGANSKRISAENAQQLTILRLGFAATTIIYLLHLAIFSSGRTKFRIFMYTVTVTSELSLWQQLEGMSQRGQSLAGKGLIQYMFDIIYVTWFTHLTTALISAKFWYSLWIIPGFALYKLTLFVLPYISPSLSARLNELTQSRGSQPSNPRRTMGNVIVGEQTGTPGTAAEVQEGVTNEILSKRQEKLRKRAERGDPRAMQKTGQSQRKW